jgi:hypothetical protein
MGFHEPATSQIAEVPQTLWEYRLEDNIKTYLGEAGFEDKRGSSGSLWYYDC